MTYKWHTSMAVLIRATLMGWRIFQLYSLQMRNGFHWWRKDYGILVIKFMVKKRFLSIAVVDYWRIEKVSHYKGCWKLLVCYLVWGLALMLTKFRKKNVCGDLSHGNSLETCHSLINANKDMRFMRVAKVWENKVISLENEMRDCG